MPERSQDLQWYREQFLSRLSSSRTQMAGHNDFLRYWQLVEREAEQTEELGKLEMWVQELARDKEKLRSVRERLEARQSSDSSAKALLTLLRRMLSLLDEIERKLKWRRDAKRRLLGWIVFVAGPGVKKKIKPGDADIGKGKGKGKGKGDPGTDGKVNEAVLAKPKKGPKRPTKKLMR